MSRSTSVDGSQVRIRRRGPEKYRWTCPEGHISWDRTNNHIWCPTCRQQHEHGVDVDPEHYHVVDQKTGECVAWERVEVVS